MTMTSPGSSTKNCEQYQTRCATPKIIVLVVPFCRFSPLTVSHMSRLRVPDLVLGDEPGAERAERLAALALVPLAARALDLEGAFGNVVGEAIAGDGVHRLVLGEIARAAADDDAKLDFVIELGRLLRHHRVVVRAADGGRRLVEDDRLLRHRHAGFGGVVGE